VLAYNGQFVGPTIRARRGRPVAVRFVNRLEHPANVHLHGGHVPAASDGHPMDVIEPGDSRVYEYPNRQQGATLWYHDHSTTWRRNTSTAGCGYLIDDDEERELGLPSGAYDIPIMLRTPVSPTTARWSSSRRTRSTADDPRQRSSRRTCGSPRGSTASRLLRVHHRIFKLRLDGPQPVQIASDGGLLPTPVPLTELSLSPGERAEVVVDFRGRLGERLVLTDASGPVLRFDVVQRASDPSRLPDRLRALPPLPPASVVRDVSLSFDPEQVQFRLDGKVFDATRVDARIAEGATEIWRITNTDTAFGIDHNFHLHMVQFRVLDRDGVPPSPGEAGWKDTVLIRPGSSVRVQATFTGYPGRYVYHCHLLEHSQLGMMAQFEVVR
jgi:FtsP/CotA-like multicopper oxidase with cupredoxin domain